MPATHLRSVIGSFAILILGLVPAVSWSATIPYTTINYTVARKGSTNTWTYKFTVQNAMSETIEALDVFFDFDLFSNLNNPKGPNATWYVEGNDPSTYTDPDSGITVNYDGNYYAEYYGAGGIAPNTSLTGFSVEVDYRFSTTPPALPFELYKINLAAVELAYGITGQPATVVPAPATAPLLVTALAVAGSRFRRRRR